MESQAPKPHNNVDQPQDNVGIFHKSNVLRGFLGVGVVFQACIAVFLIAFMIFDGRGYNSEFSFEIFRLLSLVYGIGVIWNSTIWFLCIYYNKSLPRNKLFIFLELARSIPWMLAAIICFVGATPEILREIKWNLDGGYYRGPTWIPFIVTSVVVFFGGGLALWSLVRMFIYFVKERKEEIVEALKLGQKKSNKDEVDRKDDGQDNAEARRVVNGNDSDEEVALLIDHDQMV